ncbi:hypothetical protein SGLAM104S_07568 [Streptomyces glaucescens]
MFRAATPRATIGDLTSAPFASGSPHPSRPSHPRTPSALQRPGVRPKVILPGRRDAPEHPLPGRRCATRIITCSDSRVVPALITGARPGELFELRTAGNIVPPYASAHPTSEAATIEYAVEVLGVKGIVVCGHSHCGASGAMVRGDDLTPVPAVREWLTYAADEPRCADGGDPTVAEAAQNAAP